MKELSGISRRVSLFLKKSPFRQQGELLITHVGLSGPVILHLSSLAARYLHERCYRAELIVNWLEDIQMEAAFLRLKNLKKEQGRRKLLDENIFTFPLRLWKKLIELAEIPLHYLVGHIPDKRLFFLAQQLTSCSFFVEGKAPGNKEFVTCGGVSLKEIDCKRFESRLVPHLYFAGEILDVDGLTGGFNLQHAWTSGFIAADSITSS